MPMAVGSALGGMITLIGTPPNLLISNYRVEAGKAPFDFFAFAPVGITLTIITGLLIIIFLWRLLPKRNNIAEHEDVLVQIKDYVTEVTITKSSSLVGKDMSDIEKISDIEVGLLGFIRKNKKNLDIRRRDKFQENDILIIEAVHGDLNQLIRRYKLKLVHEKKIVADMLRSETISVIEAVVSLNSPLVDKSARSLKLRSRFFINLLAIAREGASIKERLLQASLHAGDVLLLQGYRSNINEATAELGLLPLMKRDLKIGLKTNVILPALCFLCAIVFVSMQILAVEIAFLIAVVILVVARVIDYREVYSFIDWPIIVLLGAMIPLGSALQTSGGTSLIATSFLSIIGDYPSYIVIGSILIVTMLLSAIMNNVTTAIVMAPVAIAVARAKGLDIDPFLMAVVVGSSCSFLTPIGHQNSILIMGPGGYTFWDYFKFGFIIEIIVIIVAVPSILLFWPC